MKIRADRRVGLLLAGVVLLSFVAIGATIALPATDPSLDGPVRELSEQAAHGMKVFKSEGCWYCHTQYVRQTSVDAALGKPLAPGEYTGRSPSMLGLERIGPDLTYPAATDGVALAEAMETHGDAGSLSYLSPADLEALATYLLSRK